MAALRTIDPRGMTAQEWAAFTTLDLVQFGPVPVLLDDARWRDWAAVVIGLSAISGVVLPDPYDFADWADWASAFNAIMSSWSG